MRLSDEQLDAVVRRDIQDATAGWRAPERGARVRPRYRLSPLGGAALVAVAAAVVGVAIARPLAPAHRGGGAEDGRSGGAGPVRPAGDFPLGLSGASLTWDAQRGVATLFIVGAMSPQGGQPAAASRTGATWTWSATAGWQRPGAASAPPPRIQAGMAYDPDAGVALLYGGTYAGASRSDTWRWDGAQWQQLPATGPGPGPALMCWDASADRVVLVASDPDGVSSSTWTWDGATWHRLGGAPADGFVMAWDAAAGGPVLVTAASDHSAAGTWTLRGAAWRRVADAPQLFATNGIASPVFLAADRSGVLVLVGQGGDALHPQTWTWVPGGSWTRGADAPDPWAGGMVSSPVAGTLLFGGPNSLGAFAHTYRWRSGHWVDGP